MNRLYARTTWIAVAASAILWALPAQAYRMIQNTSTGRVTAGTAVTCSAGGGFTHWTTPNISWRLNTSGQGAGKATAVSNAMSAWTNVYNTTYTLTYAGTTASGWATDGTNTIVFATGNGCTGSCLALTALVLSSGQVITESDITFNASYTWNTNGSDQDTEAVAAHELGHSLGIHHTELGSTPRPTMYASYFGSSGRSLEFDDRSALACSESRYPPGPPATPGFLEVRELFCYGEVILDWTGSAGASYYELQWSNYSSFTSPTLIYSGSDLDYFANITGVKYFRVRACNSFGCSGYRNGDGAAAYYDGCE